MDTGQTATNSRYEIIQPSRHPALSVVLALCLGVVADDFLALPFSLWLQGLFAGCILGTVSFFVSQRKFEVKNSVFSATTLFLVFLLGGARHHHFVSVRSVDNVACFATTDSQPVRLRGVITSGIEFIESERGPRIPAWMELDRSRLRLRCEQLQDDTTWRTLTGSVQVDVSGHLTHVKIGERIEILGRLTVPATIANPGEFDFRQYLARQGIDALVRVNDPRAVTKVMDSSSHLYFVPRLREKVRAACESLFVQHLSKSSRVLASSILLGDRSRLNDEMRSHFVESGTMHLLAISGLHVGILAALIAAICRLANFSQRTTTICIIVLVTLYAVLANHRPPVLRAAMLISIAVFGIQKTRHVDGLNLLSVCAILLILWRPTDLFDIGAQLSFLAVAAIIWSATELGPKKLPASSNGLPAPESLRLLERLRPLGDWAYRGYVVTAAIWLATLPLTIATFHLAAPIGFVLNILLIPYVAVILSLGYLTMGVGLTLPTLVGPLAVLFDLSLQLLHVIVSWAQTLPYGHLYTPGIPSWWLIGFYFILAFLWKIWGNSRTAKFAQRALLVWLLAGLSAGLLPAKQNGLRMTVLSVGHGLAIVLELPSGQTILYDAGTFGDGRRAEQTVERYLWSRNIDEIDAVIVSHADHDHFSGLFGLMKRMPIKTIFVSQPFLDFSQYTIEDFCEEAVQSGSAIHIVQQGDQLRIKGDNSDRLSMTVLHPAAEFHSQHDNANSVVLRIEYHGRTLLLTGDLERDGLDAVLRESPGHADVLVAPHHGSRNSNPVQLFQLVEPEYVLVSTGDRAVWTRMQEEVSGDAKVFCTADSGAITVTVTPEGLLGVETFRRDSRLPSFHSPRNF